MDAIDALMRRAAVIPVLTIDDARHARPLAQALAGEGLTVIEVTLRTPAALDAIAEIAKLDGVTVGAGTVLSERDLDAALQAGARFAVSPGLTAPLVQAAAARQVPYLPGVATASEIMHGMDLGLDRFKFFPAEGAGGVRALAALAAPFAQCRFCPTGGITLERAPQWLALDAVLCVGGSWLVSKPFDAERVRKAARDAAALRPGASP